jgi:hypothetical protein
MKVDYAFTNLLLNPYIGTFVTLHFELGTRNS